jgi:hypothetical protein
VDEKYLQPIWEIPTYLRIALLLHDNRVDKDFWQGHGEVPYPNTVQYRTSEHGQQIPRTTVPVAWARCTYNVNQFMGKAAVINTFEVESGWINGRQDYDQLDLDSPAAWTNEMMPKVENIVTAGMAVFVDGIYGNATNPRAIRVQTFSYDDTPPDLDVLNPKTAPHLFNHMIATDINGYFHNISSGTGTAANCFIPNLTPDGYGWIHRSDNHTDRRFIILPKPPFEVTVISDGMNIRRQPVVADNLITTIPKGETVTVKKIVPLLSGLWLLVDHDMLSRPAFGASTYIPVCDNGFPGYYFNLTDLQHDWKPAIRPCPSFPGRLPSIEEPDATYPRVKNIHVLNAFSRAAKRYYAGAYWRWIRQSDSGILEQSKEGGDWRQNLYTGPEIADLSGLDAQQKALIDNELAKIRRNL